MATAFEVHPSKIVAVHLSYRSRAAQRGREPTVPSYFLKPPSTVAADGDTVLRPRGCRLLAFEGEIALIVGRRSKGIAVRDAWEHVAWITAANDFGVYDLRYADRGSNVRSKGIDGFTPLGPGRLDARRTAPDDLRIRTWVDGVLAQDATTADDLIFRLETMIADLSRLMTLEVGDVILTGTPAGASVVEPGSLVEVEVSAGPASTGRLRSPIAEADLALSEVGAMPAGGDDPELRAMAYGTPVAPTVPTIEEPARVGGDVVAGFRKVSTATIASQLRKRGFDHLTMDGLVAARPDMQLVGRARTLRYLPQRDDLFARRGGGFNAQKQAVEALRPGEVLVIDARGELGAGTIGDILARRAQLRGAAGVITDGAVRDSVALAELDLATYHAGVHPAVLGRRHVPWESDVPVACAGVLVNPGDLLVGDADGVVLVPDDLAADVLADSVEQERQEAFIVEQVDAGASVEGLYPIGPAWADAYHEWANHHDDGDGGGEGES